MLNEAHDLAVVLSILFNWLFHIISVMIFYWRQCEHKKEIEEIRNSQNHGSV